MDGPPLRQGQHAAVAVLHAGEPARDRAGEDQVAALDRRLLDHDPGAADRPGLLPAARRREAHGRETDLLVATIFVVFVLATLKSVADVTQVAQLGRYYLPVFALMLPPAVAGLIGLAGLACGSAGASFPGWPPLLARSSGPTRPGPTTRRGSSSAISFTGPAFARPASGSRPIPSGSRPRRGS